MSGEHGKSVEHGKSGGTWEVLRNIGSLAEQWKSGGTWEVWKNMGSLGKNGKSEWEGVNIVNMNQ